MSDELPVLRLPGLQKADARALAESMGPDASVRSEESLPVGGYGDLGKRTVAVPVTARALRAIARHLAARQQSLAETVTVVVEIDDPDATRHRETLVYKAVPGQSAIQAAETALRGLPGIGKALEQSQW